MVFEAIPLYPHMLPDERVIWHRFYTPRIKDFLSVNYDVHVGEGMIPPPGLPEWIQNVIAATSQKRIDAVAETLNNIWIVEVKSRAGMSAVGQLLAYEILYFKKFSPSKSLQKVLVCERIAADLDTVFEQYGIKIFVV